MKGKWAEVVFWLLFLIAIWSSLRMSLEIISTWFNVASPLIPVGVFWLVARPYFIVLIFWLVVIVVMFWIREKFDLKRIFIFFGLVLVIEYLISYLVWNT